MNGERPFYVRTWVDDGISVEADLGYRADLAIRTYEGAVTGLMGKTAINPEKKALLLKQKVYGHLRKASEGTNKECVRPKEQRRGIGVPSVEVTACVAPSTGRVIMFHVHEKSKGNWSGALAKGMYEGPLKTALHRTYGDLASYRIIEDGDPTGYQSSLGKEGKRNVGIRSWKLPPRTPEWNVLDYSIWREIERKAMMKPVSYTHLTLPTICSV